MSYEGERNVLNQPHGHGSFTYPSGHVYTGQWVDGLQHGRGQFTYPDGQRFEGTWRNGSRHGPGRMQTSDGRTVMGEWSGGNLTMGSRDEAELSPPRGAPPAGRVLASRARDSRSPSTQRPSSAAPDTGSTRRPMASPVQTAPDSTVEQLQAALQAERRRVRELEERARDLEAERQGLERRNATRLQATEADADEARQRMLAAIKAQQRAKATADTAVREKARAMSQQEEVRVYPHRALSSGTVWGRGALRGGGS
eukprot:6938305-Prymnesium_polylepis.1